MTNWKKIAAAGALSFAAMSVASVSAAAPAPAAAAVVSVPAVHVSVSVTYSRNRVVSSSVTTYTTGMQPTDMTRVWMGGTERVIWGNGSSGYGASQSRVLGAYGFCPYLPSGAPGAQFQMGYGAGSFTQTC